MSETSPEQVLAPILELNSRAVKIELSDFRESIRLFTEAFVKLTLLNSIKETKEYKENYLKITLNLALSHFRTAEYESSIRYTKLLMEESRFYGDKKKEAEGYLLLGNNYSSVCRFLESLKCYSQALQIFDELGDKKGTANCYNNVANIYFYQKNYSSALPNYMKALDIFKELNNYVNITVALQNIVMIMLEEERLEEALDYLSQSRDYCELTNNKFGFANADSYTGEVLIKQHKFDEALFYFDRALILHNEVNDKLGLITTLDGLGACYLNKHEFTDNKDESLLVKAEEYILQALQYAEETETEYAKYKISKSLAEFYEYVNDFEKAIKYYKLHFELGEKIFKVELDEKVNSLKEEIEEKEQKHIRDINQLKYVELAETVKKLEEVDKQKNEFFGVVVHDIKNPIGSIKMMGEILLEDESMTKEDKHEFLSGIVEASDKALKLVMELLDYNSIEHGEIKIKLTEFDANEVFEKIIRLYRPSAEAKGVSIFYTNEIINKFIRSDKNSIEHIADNLISNAIKYSPSKGNVKIFISRENNFFQMIFTDEGEGFSEEDKKIIFKQFSKLSARPTGGEHSTGLGLSIVKKLVDSLNGTIELDSEKGRGASMIVKIPLN